MIASAQVVIDTLELRPHPEGGWYRETWRGDPLPGGCARGSGTAILYLLEAGHISRWHRIDGAELWIHQGGGPVELRQWRQGELVEARLGSDLLGGERPQAVVPAGGWQTAKALEMWTLVACVVVPAFEFGAFELAAPGWEPGSP